MPTPREVAEYHDFLVYVFLHAPDEFPAEDYLQPAEQMTLQKAFARLVGDLPAISSRVKDPNRMLILRELLAMSQEAYLQGNLVRGAHVLQEFEGLVWPKHKQPPKFFAEAELRVARR
jgi:hypothetical protein